MNQVKRACGNCGAAVYDGGMITTLMLAMTPIFAAAGWAFLVYLCGGGLGTAVVVFIVLKLLGK